MISVARAQPVEMGEGTHKYQVAYSWTPSPEAGPEGEAARRELLQTFTNTLSLHICGGRNYQRMIQRYDGTKWVILLEAIHG